MGSTTMTYAILTGDKSVVGSIKYWAQHSEIPSAQVLDEAQAYLYDRIRLTEMRLTTRLAFAEGADHFPLPSGFLEAVSLRFDGDGDPLRFVQENSNGRYRDPSGNLYTGYPSRWSIVDMQGQFDVALDAAQNADLIYYAPLAPLASGNQTNVLTDKYPTLLRRACLAYAYEHRHRMDDFTAETTLVEAAINQANISADAMRRGQIMR